LNLKVENLMTRAIFRNKSLGFLIAGVIIVAILPLIIPSQWIQLLSQVLIMALFATGLNMEMGYAGMMPLGQATFLGLGAYSFGILIVKAHFSLAPAIIIALVFCLIINAIIGFLCLRGKPITFGLLHMAFNILLPLSSPNGFPLPVVMSGCPVYAVPRFLRVPYLTTIWCLG
jgi:ABC-type branched-subunit amino acid transport system permease subunit